MGLKIYSDEFRKNVLNLNLRTPPDIISGLVDLEGAAMYTAYLDSIGKDTIIKNDKVSISVINPGDIITNATQSRNQLFNKNLQPPKDIINGILNTTDSIELTQQYLEGKGKESNINDYNVINTGDVVSNSELIRNHLFNRNLQTSENNTNDTSLGHDIERGKDTVIGDSIVIDSGAIDDNKLRDILFNKNKPLNIADLSENDPLYNYFTQYGYIYSSLISSVGELSVIHDLNIYKKFIGKSTIIHDLSIPNALNIASISNQTAAVSLELGLLLNRYIPTNLESYEISTIMLPTNKNSYKYQEAYSSGVFQNMVESYEPSQFLNISVSQSAIFSLTGTSDPMDYLLNGGQAPLVNDTLLMNIAALELKFNFENRISNAIARETILSTNIDEALTNPLTALQLLNGTIPLFEKDYTISVSDNFIGKSAEFIASLAGVTSPLSFIPDIKEDYIPNCFRTDNIPIPDFDSYNLSHTGPGQKFTLFNILKINKYQPNFPDEKSGLSGIYYIGDKMTVDPLFITQDNVGDQVYTNENLTETIRYQNTSIPFDEPGLSSDSLTDGVSEYGSIDTNFIWKSILAYDTYYDVEKNNSIHSNISDNINNVNKLSYEKTFRNNSILEKTQQLLDKGLNNKYNSPIDQIITKFYDGYNFHARGNATIKPTKLPNYDKDDNIIGYKYVVPGLDATGKRNPEKMYNDASLCRVWTKDKPYSHVTDLVRFKELNRKERNSVLDRYGNLNIYPTELNVSEVYNRGSMGTNLDTVEAWGEKRARKYMFSIENLAWRDSKEFQDLPNSEKGMNGGRIMWFPPYDLQFTDDTSANWSTHMFLGRSEPIYTYNNSERSGSLNWKIVVDHPTILNVLAKKELGKLSDNEVDEILAAFWAGCVDFDTFELARIWNQFSESDINYFKTIISGLDMTKPNELITTKTEQIFSNTQPENITSSDLNIQIPQSGINGYNLYFENDVPLSSEIYKNKTSLIYDTGNIESYDIYYSQYYQLAEGEISISENAEKTKNIYRKVDINPEWMNYRYTIGKLNFEDHYFGNPNKIRPLWYGYQWQHDDIESELGSDKYKNFNFTININSHTSPLGPDKNNNSYNKQLSIRRFQSVCKWLILKVLNKTGVIYNSYHIKITPENIDDIFNSNNKVNIFRDNDTENTQDSIILQLINNNDAMISTSEIIKEIYSNPANIGGYNYFETLAPDLVGTTNVKYCCFETDADANAVINKKLLKGKYDNEHIGSMQPKVDRPYKDVVCSALSFVSSYARRVTLNIDVQKPVIKKDEIKSPDISKTTTVEKLSNKQVTKREIAQKILNKLMNEKDYFALLEKDSPIVYKTLKEKLKYFQPAFHAITPEGLNSRLTFLQQCLRPGTTIKRTPTDVCDATNTSFGRPPVCVLRIGDFYNTKIIINNLNISYEPLWDINPEGIGVQPMIANIQMSFKYIGGSGLRKYVDELQNALTFNYFANADIYDDRTYANKDPLERSLINLESSYFNNNTLDLIPIVNAAEKITPNNFNNDIPYGLVGIITKKRKPTTAGGDYVYELLSAKSFDINSVYQPYSIVVSNGKFYLRKADDEKTIATGNTKDGISAPITNINYWDNIAWRNYGEEAFKLEFNSATGSTITNNNIMYYNWYEVQYYDLFENTYKTYGEIVKANADFNKPRFEEKSILLDLILNKNYKKNLATEGNSFFNILDLINKINYSDENITGLTTGSSYTIKSVFDVEAIKRNYVEFEQLPYLARNYNNLTLPNDSISPLRLHLYPQNYLFKIGDGATLTTNGGIFKDNNRFNPGFLTGGITTIYDNQPIQVTSETAGIYLKDFSNYESNINLLLDTFINEMTAKIQLDLSHFWHYNKTSKSAFINYLKYFETPYKEIVNEYFVEKLLLYKDNLLENININLTTAESSTIKFGTLLTGLSVITDGYEIREGVNGNEYFEVIPNEVKIATNPITLFNYDPYSDYRLLTINPNETYIKDFATIKDYIDKKDLTNYDKLNFLSLGNGNYFFKQISKYSKIQDIAGSDFTYNNSLVDLTTLSSGIICPLTDPNFELSVADGIILNQYYNKDYQPGETNIRSIQPLINDDTTGSYEEYYSMSYNFEKINYELLEFSNRMMDAMINDNFITKAFDIDISYYKPFDFYTQLVNNNVGLDSAMQLYYYGKRESLKTVDLNYYTINLNSVSGTTTESICNNINTFTKYKISVPYELPETINQKLYNTVNSEFELTGLIDLFFIKMFVDLNDADKTEILTRIKASVKPSRGIDVIPSKTQDKQIAARYKQIETTLNSMFIAIKTYSDASLSILMPLYNEYDLNYTSNIKNLNRVITDKEYNYIDPNIISNSLIKGGEDDYKLVIKDTKDVLEVVKNNYKVFTNNKALFNIISENESVENIDDIINTSSDRYVTD